VTAVPIALGYDPSTLWIARCVASVPRPSMSHREPARASEPAFGGAELALVDRAFDDGRATLGTVALDREGFRAAVLARVSRHVEGDVPAPAPLAGALRRAALDDLFLALSADAGDERAWTTLSDSLRPRLEGLAVKRGLRGAEVPSIVQDVLGDLPRPPPSGAARTLLGTYDGSGSLFAWLAVSLVRRIAAKARSRTIVSLDALDDEARPGAKVSDPPAASVAAAGPGPGPASAPAEAIADRETERRFRAALSSAWATLSGRQRLVLAWKHRDGLSQRRIGALLGVGEPRVSRLVSEAIERLALGVRGVLSREDGGASGELWRRLAAAISSHLSTVDVSPPPSGEGEVR